MDLSDQVVAVSVIMSSLNINPMTSTSQTINLNSSQKLILPNLMKLIQPNSQHCKILVSPNIKLKPLVSKYLQHKIDSQTENESSLRAEITNYIKSEYTAHMINTVYGIPFIENKNDIPTNCFISAEAVWWCIEHIIEVENESEAIVLLQIMCDFDLVRHISSVLSHNVQQKLFIHGFYLYYVITDANRDHQLYTKDYCEVFDYLNFLIFSF